MPASTLDPQAQTLAKFMKSTTFSIDPFLVLHGIRNTWTWHDLAAGSDKRKLESINVDVYYGHIYILLYILYMILYMILYILYYI